MVEAFNEDTHNSPYESLEKAQEAVKRASAYIHRENASSVAAHRIAVVCSQWFADAMEWWWNGVEGSEYCDEEWPAWDWDNAPGVPPEAAEKGKAWLRAANAWSDAEIAWKTAAEVCESTYKNKDPYQ